MIFDRELTAKKILENIDSRTRYTDELPMDGTLWSFSKYMESLSTRGDNEFYRRYLNHLQYFIGIYDLKGSKEFNRIAPALIRHCIEFGKVALTKLPNGKMVPIAISKLEYNIYGELTCCEGLPVRIGYGYTKDMKRIVCDVNKTAVLNHDYLSLPMMFYWRKPIEIIMTLLQSCITGSVASIKKFKRNIQNNSSIINQVEEKSFLDPTTPYVTVIANPTGYAGMNRRGSGHGEDYKRDNYDIDNTTAPSSVDFSTLSTDTDVLWRNLKEYMEIEYYQLNRRLNTNKKQERNIAAEIQTETINFDLLDQEFKRYLMIFVEDCKDKLGEDVELKDFIVDSTPDDINLDVYDNRPIERGKVYGENEVRKIQ